MPLIVCHSPKGGAGTSFVAAQLALRFAAAGSRVSLLDCGDTLSGALCLGLAPARVPPIDGEAVTREDVSYRRCGSAETIGSMLAPLCELDPDGMLIVDLPAHASATALSLAPFAHLSLCVLGATPDCIAMAPAILREAAPTGAERRVVVNAIDELRPLARDAYGLLQTLFGPALIGRIRRDAAVEEAQAMLVPLARHSSGSAALADIMRLAEAVEAAFYVARPQPFPARRAA
jgi:MinD-like ATPase involved in chromosome partitioning or flagellar assembly